MPGLWEVHAGRERVHSLREEGLSEMLQTGHGRVQDVYPWTGKRVLRDVEEICELIWMYCMRNSI